jgi:hypothetical protein
MDTFIIAHTFFPNINGCVDCRTVRAWDRLTALRFLSRVCLAHEGLF